MSNTVGLDKKIIYLDHAATTPIDSDVFDVMQDITRKYYANPSSIYSLGREVKACLEDYRKRASGVLDVTPEEIIFTGSGTESDNLAIFGVARAHQHRGKHIIISSIEHKAVLAAAKALEKEGFDVTVLPVDKYGVISINDCMKAIRPDTILVSLIYANNEIGTVQPLEEITQSIRSFHSKYPIIHTDACQATGLLPMQPQVLGVDLMTLNSSKIYGPKGVGLLYKKKDIVLDPLVVGGDQENHMRAGTENVALIAGFVTALEKSELLREQAVERLCALQDFFIQQLQKSIPNVLLNGHPTKRLPNNVHISIPYIEGESMLLLLDEVGIMVSTGSACSSADLAPSHVLTAIGQDSEIMHGSLRFSFGRNTTQEELVFVVSELERIVAYLSSLSALTSSVYVSKK